MGVDRRQTEEVFGEVDPGGMRCFPHKSLRVPYHTMGLSQWPAPCNWAITLEAAVGGKISGHGNLLCFPVLRFCVS